MLALPLLSPFYNPQYDIGWLSATFPSTATPTPNYNTQKKKPTMLKKPHKAFCNPLSDKEQFFAHCSSDSPQAQSRQH
jgi:hypothetical protein